MYLIRSIFTTLKMLKSTYMLNFFLRSTKRRINQNKRKFFFCTKVPSYMPDINYCSLT